MSQQQKQQKPKVLIIRFSSLGDVVHASAAIAPLAAANCEIYFLTKSSFAEIWQSMPNVAAVYAFDKKELSEKAARENFFAWMDSQNFSFVVDLHDSLRTKLWRSNLRKRTNVYVARKPRLREFAVLFLRLKMLFGLGKGGRAKLFRQTVEKALEAESLAVKNYSDSNLTRFASAPVLSEALQAKLPKKKYLVLMPGSAWQGKMWPQKYFMEFAQNFAEIAPIVVLGAKNDFYCDEIARVAQEFSPESISLRGETSIQECAAVIANAQLVFGNDTGLLHVAEAIGKNVVMIEGPTHESLGFSPYREGSQILAKDLFCRPCSKSGKFCWRWGSRACINDISVQDALDVVRDAWMNTAK